MNAARRLARPVCLALVVGTAFASAGCGGRPSAAARRPASPITAGRPASQPTATGDTLRLAGVPRPGQSDFEIHVDREALAAMGVAFDAVGKAVSRFFQAYPFFSLTDLREVAVPTADGSGTVRLREVADVEVWFGSANTQVVVREPK